MNEEELLRRLKEAFNVEAEERIASMSSSLLELEKTTDRDSQEPVLEVVFREAHSLKGAARSVNLGRIEHICQAMETVFSAVRREDVSLSRELFDLLHDCLGAIEDFQADIEIEGTPAYEEKIEGLVTRLDDFRQAGPRVNGGSVGEQRTIAEDVPTEKPRTGESVEKPSEDAETVGPDPDGTQMEAVEGETDFAVGREEQTHEHVKKSSEPIASRARSSETIRISTTKLDAILLQAEEMISLKLMSNQYVTTLHEISGAFEDWNRRWRKVEPVMRRLSAMGTGDGSVADLLDFAGYNQEWARSLDRQVANLNRGMEQGNRLLGMMVDDLLNDMKNMAMLPFSTLLDLFPRMVREISRDQNKQVDFILSGGEIEIDRRILEEMKDPLIHILRNSIDHGIEWPEVREKAGKGEKGTISVTVSQNEGNKIDLIISDDGNGIDLRKVKEKAISIGMASAADLEKMKDEKALSFILRSGVSTSPIITELSGRGLGLAIVAEKVEKLGGKLSIENSPGKGTTFNIKLPVTVATFRGILIRVGERLFVIPSANVERSLRVHRDEVKTVENMATIPMNGRAVSLVYLDHLLHIEKNTRLEEVPPYVTAVVLGSGEKRIAFVVDEVMGEQEVLVKSLGKQLVNVTHIAGATILGSGKVVPVLNVHDLLKAPVETSGAVHSGKARRKDQEVEKSTILVAEDSITSRMLLKNILEGAGYVVTTAVDGQEAFTKLKMEPFDLVVSDVEMPRMNGFQLTSNIRNEKKLEDLPVVLVTSLESREDREKGIDAGANAYIIKGSFDQNNLLDVIDKLL
jgi:two-component system chemotaxis sensor kinase CheA